MLSNELYDNNMLYRESTVEYVCKKQQRLERQNGKLHAQVRVRWGVCRQGLWSLQTAQCPNHWSIPVIHRHTNTGQTSGCEFTSGQNSCIVSQKNVNLEARMFLVCLKIQIRLVCQIILFFWINYYYELYSELNNYLLKTNK